MGAGDGVWFFYAKQYLSNTRLYSELHLVQQPIFILYNAFGIKFFGDSYLAQKFLFVPLIAIHLYLTYLLVLKADLSSLLSALLYLAVFFVGIHFEAYRFDDYHFFANTLILFLLLFFVDYSDESLFTPLIKIFFCGVISTLCLLTRVNDGLLYWLITLIFIVCLAKPSFKKDTFVFILSSIITFAITLSVIRETPFDWIKSTIFDAASNKGGAGLLITPFLLIVNSFDYLVTIFSNFSYSLISLILLLSVVIVNLSSLGFINLIFLFFLVFHLALWINRSPVDLISNFTAISILGLLGYWLLLLFNFLISINKKTFSILNLRLIFILAFPTLAFVSGAISSGGHHFGLYFPAALFLLSTPYVGELNKLNKICFGFGLALLVLSGLIFRFNNPYSWHSYYSSNPMLVERKLEWNNSLGWIYMDEKLKQFILPVCKTVEKDATLLSLPFPFANYYCGIPIWHGYVQTFFDTASSQSIDRLKDELDRSPPDYVFYQQQLDNLRGHEIIFNKSNPLPHRMLDKLIIQKIETGKWMVVYKSNYGVGNNWYLIKTNE